MVNAKALKLTNKAALHGIVKFKSSLTTCWVSFIRAVKILKSAYQQRGATKPQCNLWLEQKKPINTVNLPLLVCHEGFTPRKNETRFYHTVEVLSNHAITL